MLRAETAASPTRRAAALEGLRRYQAAARGRPRRLGGVRHRRGAATLRFYGGDSARPVVFIPSLINPPHILDLSREASLLRFVARRGLATWLVDWGMPGPRDRDLDIAGHVTRRLVPLLATLPAPPLLVGYCLGGTMAIAAAARAPVAGVATIAAPWRFAGYGDEARRVIADMWESARAPSEAMGLVPIEVLQNGFWQLDPARTIAKYERFARLDPGSAEARAFVVLEDWANAGAPLTFAAGTELFETLIAADLPGNGAWRVGGAPVDPARLPCPAIEFVARDDRIVPAATAIGLADRRDVPAGHVGMIVGGRARATLWEPLTDWLSARVAPR